MDGQRPRSLMWNCGRDVWHPVRYAGFASPWPNAKGVHARPGHMPAILFRAGCCMLAEGKEACVQVARSLARVSCSSGWIPAGGIRDGA